MKKLLLIGMLLLSGLAQAAKQPTDEEYSAFYKALSSANAQEIARCMQEHAQLKNTKWEGNLNPFNIIVNAKPEAGKPDNRIPALEALIQAGYKVTPEDLQLCFALEHKAILVALTKLVKVAQDEKLVSEILRVNASLARETFPVQNQKPYAHFTQEFKKELLANLKAANPALLQQSYVLEVLLNLEESEELDAWIHTLVNEGAVVSDDAKSLIAAKITNPQNSSQQIDNPRLKLLVKDSEQAAASLTSDAAVPVLCVSAGLVVSLIIWKKYGKKIKAFFAGEDDEDDKKEVKNN